MGFAAQLRLSAILLLLALVAGCSNKDGASGKSGTNLTGTVTYKGELLPGGNMSFVASDGTKAAAVIDATGAYSVSLAPGEWRIAIVPMKEGGEMPKTTPNMTPEMFAKMKAKMKDGKFDPTQFVAKHVPIPEKYQDAKTSGLSVTVQAGPQSKDIKID